MLDLNKAPKKTLVSALRQLRRERGAPVAAASTLSRMPNQKLQADVAELCGDDFAVDDAGRAVRRPVELPAAPPAKPGRAAKPAMRAVDGADAATPPREDVIVQLRADNPKHPGSASHARYALLRSGLTVAAYLAAAGSRGRRTLQKAIRQGHARVDAPGRER